MSPLGDGGGHGRKSSACMEECSGMTAGTSSSAMLQRAREFLRFANEGTYLWATMVSQSNEVEGMMTLGGDEDGIFCVGFRLGEEEEGYICRCIDGMGLRRKNELKRKKNERRVG